jgi:hypothetical protein
MPLQVDVPQKGVNFSKGRKWWEISRWDPKSKRSERKELGPSKSSFGMCILGIDLRLTEGTAIPPDGFNFPSCGAKS